MQGHSFHVYYNHWTPGKQSERGFSVSIFVGNLRKRRSSWSQDHANTKHQQLHLHLHVPLKEEVAQDQRRISSGETPEAATTRDEGSWPRTEVPPHCRSDHHRWATGPLSADGMAATKTIWMARFPRFQRQSEPGRGAGRVWRFLAILRMGQPTRYTRIPKRGITHLNP